MSSECEGTAGAPQAGLAEIIVPVHDHPWSAVDCLHSVWQCTPEPYHVIVIDDGSTDVFPHLLGEFVASGMPLTIIRNEECRGFVKAANQGLQASCGEYTILLSSDIRVGPRWLPGLVEIAESDATIGIVGPTARTLGSYPRDHSGAQRVSGALDSGDAYPAIAPDSLYVDTAGMLIERRVLDAVGYLDETCAASVHAAADYCARAREAGFRIARSLHTEVYRTVWLSQQQQVGSLPDLVPLLRP